MKYQYKITYLNSNNENCLLETYCKMWIISEYINLLTKSENISDLKIYRINVKTQKEKEITEETNKFLYK